MPEFDSARLDEFIQEEIQTQNIPGLSLSFTGPTGTLFEKSYGYCDIKQENPVNPDTIMGVASLSKSFTAVALALLEEEGKLEFTDPVTRFFPNFKIPGTPKDAVLIKHLLDHTSGLPLLPTLQHCMDTHAQRDEGETRETDTLPRRIKVDTVEDIINYIVVGDYEPLGQPGEYMNYSNDGYAILSSIVDQAAGISMEEYLDQKVFQPLGMRRSALGFHRLVDFENVTQLFSKGDDDTISASDNWPYAPPYRGCGWIISSSRDMAKYYSMLSQEGCYDGRRVLPKGAAKRLFGNDYPSLRTGVYTYGLSKAVWQDHVLYSHTGGLKGISSAGAFLDGAGYAGVVLTNIGGINAMRILMGAFNLLKGLEPDTPSHAYRPVARDPQEPHIYEGFYSGREAGLSRCAYPFKVELLDGELSFTPPRQQVRHKLHFCGQNVFLAAEEGKDPIREGFAVTFFVDRDQAWGMKIGSRIFQRI